MKIFKDLITDCELFSDALNVKESPCGSYYTFETKRVIKKDGDIDGSLIGANASQEEVQEQMEESVTRDFEFVLNSQLQICPAYEDKTAFKCYLKDYFKKVADHVSKTKPECLDQCKKDALAFSKMLLPKHSDLSCYFGEKDEEFEGTGCIVEWTGEDTGIVYVFKAALKEEKC